MSSDKLISMGAECVGGDLILNRQVVGIYRNGQFIITPEGAEVIERVVDIEAVEVQEPAPVVRARGKAKAAAAEPAPEVPVLDPTEGLDDILNKS